MTKRGAAAIDRVMTKVVAGQSECWVFTGTLSSSGYGVIVGARGGSSPRTARAHRVTYEFFRAEIPVGLVIDHLCRNRACVNPWHLEPVDQWTNVLRGAQATQTHCRRAGHELNDENTYWQWQPSRPSQASRSCKECRRDANSRVEAAKRAARKVQAAA